MAPIKYILVIFFAAIYVCFGYFLQRSNFIHLTILFGAGFIIYFFIISTTKDKKEVDILLWISMIFRIIFIVAIPCLSEDYFRFIWDGKLFLNGFNPYLFIPSEIINTDIAKTAGLTQDLYNGLNTPEYYTVYPPISQLIFSLGGFFSKFGMLAGIIAIRIPILIAEFVTIKYIRRLLNSLELPHYNILWYALNPLVIVELSGNLHFEGMMLMFVVIGIYWLIQNKWGGAAIWWAMAIGVKLIPILLLPILLKRLGLIKSFWFYVVIVLTLTLTFLPFLDNRLIHHLLLSAKLHFNASQFNGSIYYIIQWVGVEASLHLRLILTITSFVLIITLSFYKNNNWGHAIKKMLFAYSIYLLLATTIYPWDLVSLVLLSVFIRNYRYAIAWAAIVILSYSAYMSDSYEENVLFIITEYVIVFSWGIIELLRYRKLSN